ncbi:MAG: DNA-protecting protein DprA [Rhodobacterales bacterium]|nr:MAG: DNA-protecting protein DprA [Rhodobacterales bacterium]
MDGSRQASLNFPAPQPAEDDPFDRLRLLRSRRVGIATYRRLLAEYGTARAALDALPEIAKAAGDNSYRPCPLGVVAAELKAGRTSGARMIWESDPDYPRELTDLEDAPPMLWMIGDADHLNRPMIALIGARNASSLGTRMARLLAAELGEAGYTVVSGLARGIDAAAHDEALPSGTVAVVGGGVDVVYPRENAALRDRIAKDGVILSEQPVGLQPMARHFPRRNRLISGLARAVVVVEAAARSGSLMTARIALDQGREVMAVPGHPLDGRASGTNQLIRDGAVLVRGAQDVLSALPPVEGAASPPAPSPAITDIPHSPETPLARRFALNRRKLAEPGPGTGDRLRRKLLERLSSAPISEDALLADLGLSPSEAAPLLTELELSGDVVRHPGGALSRVT